MTAEKELDQLRGSDAELNYLVPCAELTVYWRGSCFDRSDSIVRFYQKVIADIGHHFKFYETGTMAGAKSLRADSLDLLPFWLQKSKPRKDIYQLYLESGPHRNEPSESSLYFIADEEEEVQAGALKIGLPAASLTQDPDAFVQKVLSYVDDLDFESGHAGYGVNWNPRGETALEAQEAMARIAAKYQGVDLFDLDVTMVAMRKTEPAGIKCINWLTLIGDTLLGLLGGKDKLAARLAPPCTLYPMKHGALLRAGRQALIGNRNRQADMSAYDQIGRLLSPFRFIDHQPIVGGSIELGEDATQRWLARFDD